MFEQPYSRRNLLRSAAAIPALAVLGLVAAKAMPERPTPLPPALAAAALVPAGPQDPIFAMIAEWLALRNKIDGSEANAGDADETRLLRAHPRDAADRADPRCPGALAPPAKSGSPWKDAKETQRRCSHPWRRA